VTGAGRCVAGGFERVGNAGRSDGFPPRTGYRGNGALKKRAAALISGSFIGYKTGLGGGGMSLDLASIRPGLSTVVAGGSLSARRRQTAATSTY